MGHQIMTLRMGKAGALFLWVRKKLFVLGGSCTVSSTDICVSHGVLRLPNCSPCVFEDCLCLQS
jgi:hypothetical protein